VAEDDGERRVGDLERLRLAAHRPHARRRARREQVERRSRRIS
jgi:hypothetical protein